MPAAARDAEGRDSAQAAAGAGVRGVRAQRAGGEAGALPVGKTESTININAVDPDAVLRQFDEDGDGEIDADEMREINRREAERREGVEQALAAALAKERELARRHDEFDRVIAAEQAQASREVHPILKALDQDGDGTVDLDELEGAMSPERARQLRAQVSMSDEVSSRMPAGLALPAALRDHAVRQASESRVGRGVPPSQPLVALRARLHSVGEWLAAELSDPPLPGPSRGPALRGFVEEVRSGVAALRDVMHHCERTRVDADAPSHAAVPGPTPVHALDRLVQVFESHAQRTAELWRRVERVEEARAAKEAEFAALDIPIALSRIDELPQPRLPETDGARLRGWDRLWDQRRRNECQHVLAASRQRLSDLSDDIALGQQHMELIDAQAARLRETSVLIESMRGTVAEARQTAESALASAHGQISAYEEKPRSAAAACDHDAQLVSGCTQRAADEHAAACSAFRRAHGMDADWYAAARREEMAHHHKLVALRGEHHKQVKELTDQLDVLHQQKKAEERRLMAASMQYFNDVERQQRELVTELERLQAAFVAQSGVLCDAMEAARRERRRKEEEEAATLETAIAAEQRRRVMHTVLVERLHEMAERYTAARSHLTDVTDFVSMCRAFADQVADSVGTTAAAQTAPLNELHSEMLLRLHKVVGQGYTQLAQLVYKNGVRRSEAQKQQKVVAVQLQFCRETWDPNEARHRQTLAELDDRLAEVAETDAACQQRMSEHLREQKEVAAMLRGRGADPPPNARAELERIFDEEREAQQARAPPPHPGAVALITDGSANGAQATAAASPVRVWQQETDRLAEQCARADVIAGQERARLVRIQLKEEQEHARLELLRLNASATAAAGRTQHAAKRHLKKQRRGQPQPRRVDGTPEKRPRPGDKGAKGKVCAAVIRIDFPEVNDDDAIELPDEPSRLDKQDERVRRLLEFDVAAGSFQASPPPPPPGAPPPPPPGAPPPPPPGAPPPPPCGPYGVSADQWGAEWDTARLAAVEDELTMLMQRGQIPALAVKREELIRYLERCLAAATDRSDAALAAQLRGHRARYV